jgi:two-component system invasion response regulator UvrY
MEPIRVLIADDHPLIIEGLKTSLARHGIKAAGTASAVAEVVPKYEHCQPDVVVLDVRFGDGPTGLDVAKSLLNAHPQARIVIYTQYDQDGLIREAYRIGCAAFVTKNKDPQLLSDAIKDAHTGKTFFLKEIAERLALISLRGEETHSPLEKLDSREIEILKMMALGKRNAEIAEAMNLSVKTISTASQTIKDKLGVDRPAELALLAVRLKLIEP